MQPKTLEINRLIEDAYGNLSVTLLGNIAPFPIKIYWDGVRYELNDINGDVANRVGNALHFPKKMLGDKVLVDYWVTDNVVVSSNDNTITDSSGTSGTCSTIRFIINNIIPYSTLSSSHVLATDMDQDHLKTEWRSRVMRHNNVQDRLTISGDFEQHRTLSAFAIAGFNISASGYISLRIYDKNNANKTLLFDSGDMNVGILKPQGDFVWGVDPWGLASNEGVNPTFSYYFNEVIGNHYEIDFYDPDSFDGHIDIRQIFLGDTLSLDSNFSYGMSIQWQSSQQIVRTEGASLITIGNNQVWRKIQLPFDYMTEADRERLSYQQRLRAGETIFMTAYPDGTDVQKKEFSMAAKFPPPTFVHSSFESWQTSLELLEI